MTNPIFERKYSEITRSDHSTELREGVRAFWAQGEMLWDEDMDNAMTFFRTFGFLVVDFRKPKHPPLFRPDARSFISLSGADAGKIIVQTPSKSFVLTPFAGLIAYIEADKEFVLFDGVNWKPYAVCPQPPAVEISFFMTDVFAGQDAASVRVSTPFRIWQSSKRNKCRGRGVRIDHPLLILKNGEIVGAIKAFSENIAVGMKSDTDFAAGDVLTVRGADQSCRNVAVTIYGELI